MKIVKDYEVKVLDFLISDLFGPTVLNKIIRESELANYDYTGAGYFLEISHSDLPRQRIIRDKPIVIGEAENITAGFVVFIENNRLTLECHSWCEADVPKNFRDFDVQVRAVKIEDGAFVDLGHSV